MSGLAAHAEEFLRRLSQERRLSPRTVSAYRGDLHLLLQKAEEDGGRGAMQPRDIRRWLMAERARKISPTSIARRLSAWRMFFDYLTRNGVVASNPARGIRPPKKAARLPRALTPDEMARFLDAKESSAPTSNIRAGFAKNKSGKSKHDSESESVSDLESDFAAAWRARRDAAMFELLYSAGMRVGEMTALDVADMDLSSGVARIRAGKGGRGRAAPFGAAALRALQNWMPMREKRAECAALFVNWRGRRLSVRAVQLRTARRAATVGGGRVTPHALRHSCASHFLQSSGDLRATQELLGHRDIAATQIYTRLDFQNLAAAYDRAHPRAHLAKK